MKRLLALVLCLAIGAGLVGCGTQDSPVSDFADVTTNSIPADIKELASSLPPASYESLPAWRGLEYEVLGDYPDGYSYYGFAKGWFTEQDIKNMADLGFNFVRVPVNTKFFYAKADINKVNEKYWVNLDELIAWGIQYGVHISIVVCETYGHNCTYSEEESELFTNDGYMTLFLTYWETLAQRYADIPNNALSFNILNEPCDWIGEERYCDLALNVAERIRTHSPERLIISDMMDGGTMPIYGLVDARIVQSIHCYEPSIFHQTPYDSELATWPMLIDGETYDIDWLRDYLQKYVDFEEETGVTIFMNEFGVPVTANYEATLAYMDDLLTVVNDNGWCWAMYDYVGPFCLVKGNNIGHVRHEAEYVKMGDCTVDSGLYEVLRKH